MSLSIAEGVTPERPRGSQLPGLTIHLVEPDSPAALAGLRPGDRLLSLNGRRIRDEIDFLFHEMASSLVVEYIRVKSPETVTIEKMPEESLGIKLPPLAIRQCRNKCVFCFVDQQPRDLRKTLHIKDDDYRYSFLHGNFITMTNVSDAEINRIIEEKLSPQYVSVQAVDPDMHRRLLGIPKVDPVLPKIVKLIEGGVNVHTQIVVIPGWNDADVLLDSVSQLLNVLPADGSLSLVPVGLTKYRNGLTDLRTPNREEALRVIEDHWNWREQALAKHGSPLVYCADEWFSIAGIAVPSADYYGKFEQVENGVGMMRKLEVDTLLERPRWIKRLPRNVRWSWVTGTSAGNWLRDAIAPILMDAVPQLEIEVIPVTNRFWGDVVTVANLLTGQDVWNALESHGPLGELVVLPPDIVNGDRLFLDDWTLDDLQKAVLSPQVVPFPGSFAPLLRRMLTV